MLLAGCMGMNQMFMSEEQEAQYCDSYRSMLTNPNVTAQQRGQIIQGMNQMDCPNTPPAVGGRVFATVSEVGAATAEVEPCG